MNILELFAELKKQLDPDVKTPMLRTAFLWGDEDLLGKAIESLLNATNRWQVIKIPDLHDVYLLIREVKRVKPNVIFVNKGISADDFPIPIHLIQEFPELKIITVNSENNLIEVYNKQKIQIKEASDLLSLIEASAISPGSTES